MGMSPVSPPRDLSLFAEAEVQALCLLLAEAMEPNWQAQKVMIGGNALHQ